MAVIVSFFKIWCTINLSAYLNKGGNQIIVVKELWLRHKAHQAQGSVPPNLKGWCYHYGAHVQTGARRCKA